MNDEIRVSGKHFCISVVGDTGYDVCVVPSHHQPRADGSTRSVSEFEVPSGAQFLKDAFDILLRDQAAGVNFSTTNCQPRTVEGQKASGLATLPASLLTLASRPKYPYLANSDATTYRVSHITPALRRAVVPAASASGPMYFDKDDTGRIANATDLLVVHVGAEHCRLRGRSDTTDETVASLITAVHKAKKPILLNLDPSFPDVNSVVHPADSEKNHARWNGVSAACMKDRVIWDALYAACKHVSVYCSSRMLRHECAAIARHSSWERSIEDLLLELSRFGPIRPLQDFAHLIVRFGVIGAVHIQNTGCERHAQLIFAPLAPQGVYRTREEHGDIVGYKAILMASLARTILNDKVSWTDHVSFGSSLRTGLLAVLRAFDAGYPAGAIPPDGRELMRFNLEAAAAIIRHGHDKAVEEILGQPFDQALIQEVPDGHSPRFRREQTVGRVPIPDKLLTSDPQWFVRPYEKRRADDDWQILRDSLGQGSDGFAFRINVGTAIVRYGCDEVLNRNHTSMSDELKELLARPECLAHAGDRSDCITLANGEAPSIHLEPSHVNRPPIVAGDVFVPVIRFGDLTLIEREEIEALRSARNVIEDYAAEQRREAPDARPISLAVFGPPGSGKSFAIKQIKNSIPDTVFISMEFNVSQFRSVADLERAAGTIVGRRAKQSIPLVFFDEFDCEFERRPFGWLKHFLAIMQDGVYYGSRTSISFGPAILIFAGSICHSFREFEQLATQALLEHLTGQRPDWERRGQEFRERKGPDFISRLHGHVDIMPINRPAGIPKFIIRRAVLLRSFLERRHLLVKTCSSSKRPLQLASIDEDVTHALLTVNQYRHGVRSMEAIVRMCSPINGRIEKASLPPRSQLAMHVDADEFVIMMNRGRFRRTELDFSTGG